MLQIIVQYYIIVTIAYISKCSILFMGFYILLFNHAG